MKKLVNFSLALLLLILTPSSAFAYIGPGAGFAFIGSGFVFVITFAMALLTISFWPLQWAWRRATGKRIRKDAKARRVVILGLDGLEPSLVEKYMADGSMPNLKLLSQKGSFKRLGTTLPALSPVAWSSFQTGVNPGAHNIFDFLTRDKRHYVPFLSSSETDYPPPFKLFGRFKLGYRRPQVRILRKSQPFWKILGKHGVFSNVIRVPISYPPEKFNGNQLSAMCTPDLRGSQGAFTMFTTQKDERSVTGGEITLLEKEGEVYSGKLIGPPDTSGRNGAFLTAKFLLKVNSATATGILEVNGSKTEIKLEQFSPWIKVEFKAGFRKIVTGIFRVCLRAIEPQVYLYVSPINIDPVRPALPISAPLFFSTYLAKSQGPYGTLGLMEDTWGRNEMALDDRRFLEQTYLTHDEREKMFFNMLDKTPEGVCVCVFDASDRIQHMFWRYMDDRHPSPREEGDDLKQVIPEMYKKMDELVGKTVAKLKSADVLIVLSDHGFTSFRRCINLNTWLMNEGYLVLKDGVKQPTEYLQGVDWEKTRAFALGLTGIYINRRGREAHGIVDPKAAPQLKQELAQKLKEITDPTTGESAVRDVHDTAKAYKGLYTDEAPDIIVGWEPGFRVSWESVKGIIEPEVFSDNVKAWSGDHHVEPKCIPGILFSNRPIQAESPHIVDIAPTVLDLFRVPVPPYMEGKALL